MAGPKKSEVADFQEKLTQEPFQNLASAYLRNKGERSDESFEEYEGALKRAINYEAQQRSSASPITCGVMVVGGLGLGASVLTHLLSKFFA